jgi:hypothetical protein
MDQENLANADRFRWLTREQVMQNGILTRFLKQAAPRLHIISPAMGLGWPTGSKWCCLYHLGLGGALQIQHFDVNDAKNWSKTLH